MNDENWLIDRFEADRPHLRSVAYRMLGSASAADDAVQEAWIRLHRSDISDVQNLRGWLTTVVARVSLDMLRSRASHREVPLSDDERVSAVAGTDDFDPEDEAMLADSIGLALLVVLDKLSPLERVAFVLHDMFAVPFDEIAPIVGRSPTATRQLASRARGKVRGVTTVPDPELSRQRQIVAAFLAASRGGDLGALVALLDPDIVLRADDAAVQSGATREARGATLVAQNFFGRAQAAQPALIDGVVGLVWAPGGRARVVFRFVFAAAADRVAGIALIADPEEIERIDVVMLDDDVPRNLD
jgi:RNA polymerase sigma-70 factor (ECF subfamily)